MSAILHKSFPRFGPAPATQPRRKVWSVPQFHFMGDLGLFEGSSAMLIEGNILEEGPMNPPHSIALEKSDDVIRTTFGRGWRMRIQMPLVLGFTTDPHPDIVVVRGPIPGQTVHPTTADLIVEISDTSLAFDTNEKMSLYASAGIADQWVVDVVGRKLLVYRTPILDPTSPHGSTYSIQLAFSETKSVVPLSAPRATIGVSELLP